MSGKCINKDNFLSLNYSDAVDEIIQPIKSFGITFFHYFRIYNDLSRITLTNKPEWYRHFYEKCYYNEGWFSCQPLDLHPGFYLWNALKECETSIDAKENFGIGNGMTLVKIYDNYRDIFIFGSDAENYQINNFYLNNIDVIDNYTHYYLTKSKKIRDILTPDIYVEDKTNKQATTELARVKIDNAAKKQFESNTTLKRYELNENDHNAYLTRREFQIIDLLSKGISIKAAAIALGIGERTIRSYLENAKVRLGVYSNEQLIKLKSTLIP